MSTEAKIKAKYKAKHDSLSESYYSGSSGLSKEEFDQQHGQIWAGMKAELIAEGYLTIPDSPRNLEAEIDELNKRIRTLETIQLSHI